MNSAKNGAIQIGRDFIFLLGGCNKVIGTVLSKLFDSEVIYNESEINGACDMVEKSRSVVCGYVSIFG